MKAPENEKIACPKCLLVMRQKKLARHLREFCTKRESISVDPQASSKSPIPNNNSVRCPKCNLNVIREELRFHDRCSVAYVAGIARVKSKRTKSKLLPGLPNVKMTRKQASQPIETGSQATKKLGRGNQNPRKKRQKWLFRENRTTHALPPLQRSPSQQSDSWEREMTTPNTEFWRTGRHW